VASAAFAIDNKTTRGGGFVAAPGVAYPVTGSVSRFVFRLDEATYAVRHVTPDQFAFASLGHKLLILKYTLKNAESHALDYTAGAVRVQVLGMQNETYTGANAALRFLDGPRSLKPGEAVTETVVLEIPGALATPRLVARIGGAELKYDLTGRVKPLSGPFAGANGSVSVDEHEAAKGQKTPLGAFDLKLVSIESTREAPEPSLQLGTGEQFAIATVELTNATRQPQAVSYASVTPEMTAADGTKVEWTRMFLGNKAGDPLRENLGGRRTIVGRFVFKVKSGQRPAELRLFDAVSGRRSILIRL